MFLDAGIKSTAGNKTLSPNSPQCKIQYINCGTLLAIYFVQSEFPKVAETGKFRTGLNCNSSLPQ